jgi:D-sedoheptulose 7-phosphate isomerase
MNQTRTSFILHAQNYLDLLNRCFDASILESVEALADDLKTAWHDGRQIYLCGNGGSAANAMHIANDLHFGAGACGPPPAFPGLRVEALTANSGIVTCLANDIGYENIFAHQLEVKARPGDLLIALSGSGNSPNIIKALDVARRMEMRSYAIVAFTGGKCLELADRPIYFPIDDMQIAEDTQLIVGHLCMQWLTGNKPPRG